LETAQLRKVSQEGYSVVATSPDAKRAVLTTRVGGVAHYYWGLPTARPSP
jgi:hypothetical protein